MRYRRHARLISRFSDLSAQLENDAFDPAGADAESLALFEGLRRAAKGCDPRTTFFAIAEVDRFALLRQSAGFKLANALLAKVAERLTSTIAGAEIGRVGRTSIEFAFRAHSWMEAELRLFEALESAEKRIDIDGYAFDLSLTVGFADASLTSLRDELIDQAAAAVATAQARRIKVAFADPDVLAQNSRGDLDLMRALPQALQDGEIELFYQPKLEARTNSIRSAEALVRWTRPGAGLIPTDRFIEIAEETGAIRDLSKWVVERAVQDQRRLLDAGIEMEIYVNISGQILPDREFARDALSIVQGAAGKIGFEITETAVIGDPDAALANLREFTEAGIRIAIDDYGSGLSSLAYLKQLPANELKIDRMFVSGLVDSHRDPLLVRSSIDLAHALEMEVTAEGVDDAMALSLLRVMGCDLLQGYYIAPPLSLDGFIDFLNDEEQMRRIAGSLEHKPWNRSEAAR